jgi:hypothetical protein
VIKLFDQIGLGVAELQARPTEWQSIGTRRSAADGSAHERDDAADRDEQDMPTALKMLQRAACYHC